MEIKELVAVTLDVDDFAEEKFARTLRDGLLDVSEEFKKVDSVTVKYKKPYPHRWAIVEYEGLGYYVGEYLIYGKEIVANKTLECWVGLPYMTKNPITIQEGFATKEEALAALPKYKNSWALPG